uniref:Phenazine biosynthesis-like domain-containing protein 1 n=1 Tax=Parastrongyloides trichosuri TaxID=131310 RepID=A0A0N4ZPB3_PARTI
MTGCEKNIVPIYIVDAFTNKKFAGNQAAVFIYDMKLHDSCYKKIAAEFNLSETAYPVPLNDKTFKDADRFTLKWFTPKIEVNLCGHATLATSHVIFNELKNINKKITFETLSGDLEVERGEENESYVMNFPIFNIKKVSSPNWKNVEPNYGEIIDSPPELYLLIKTVIGELSIRNVGYAEEAKKLIVELDGSITKDQLLSISPNFSSMLAIHPNGDFVKGFIVTVKPNDSDKQGFVDKDGKKYDYASRYFAPWVGINEDPATGSSQCALAPYYKARLGINGPFYAFQCYPNRGAQFKIRFTENNRLMLTGYAKTIVTGTMAC